LNESLIRFWQDWKNVIIITILVIINITSLTWAPLVAGQFKSDPAEVEALAKNIQDTLWLIVFIYAAQIIFTNRRKRIEASKDDAESLAESPAADQPVDPRANDRPMQGEGPKRAPRPPIERRRRR